MFDCFSVAGDSQIEVNMVLLWRDQITILYLAVATWPLSAAKLVFYNLQGTVV